MADEPDKTDRYAKLIGLFHLAGIALFLFALFMFWVALHHFFGIWPAPCNIPGTAC